MKWYAWNIGDYAGATQGLTFAEHGVYRAMIDAYMQREAPLPADPREVCRLIGARGHAVRIVSELLPRFFVFSEGTGWKSKTCDQVLARFNDRTPHRDAKKEGVRKRQEKFRNERKYLYEQLHTRGVVLPFNTHMREVRAIAQRMGVAVPQMNGTPSVEKALDNALSNASRHDSQSDNSITSSVTRYASPPAPEGAAVAARATEVAERMAALGIANASSDDAALRALIAQGATAQDFDVLAGEASATGKSWAWVLHRVGYRVHMRGKAPT